MHSNLPEVTVFIPSYNHIEYVEQAIRSVLSQTYKNIALLVVDDGSTDGSVEKLYSLSEKYGFRFVAQKNNGLTKTLNKVVLGCGSKYFSMLSSDDIITADKISKQVDYMERHPEVALCGGSHIEINEDGVCSKRQKVNPYAVLDFEDILLEKKSGPSAVTMLARTDSIKSVDGYDEQVRLEDLDMYLKLTSAGYKVATLNDFFGYYRKHSLNTYKNIRFMYESILFSYAKYKDCPSYMTAVSRLKKSYLLKAARTDKALAFEILRSIPLCHYDVKVVRGFLKIIFSR